MIAGNVALGVLGGISGLITPGSVSGLELWLRADRGVTLTSGKVSQWDDYSGHARHATQGTAAKRPTISSAVQNGKDGMLFDPAHPDFLAGSLPVAMPTNGTVMVVTKPNSNNFNGGVFDATDAGALTNTGYLVLHENTVHEIRVSGFSGQHAATYAPAAQTPLMYMLHRAGAALSLYEKTTLKDSRASLAGDPPTLTQYRIGQLFQDVFPWTGLIFEVAVWSKALSSQERSDMSTYANSIWAV